MKRPPAHAVPPVDGHAAPSADTRAWAEPAALDPLAWNGIYEGNDRPARDAGAAPGGGAGFRRSLHLAECVCLRVSRPGERWCDLGCGTGQLAARLSAAGRPAIGVDRDAAMISFAARHAATSTTLPAAPLARPVFVRADACLLPFPDESLHGVIATSLTGCLASVEAFLREVFRVLGRDGFAIVTFTNRDSLLMRVDWLATRVRHALRRRPDCSTRFRSFRCPDVLGRAGALGFSVREARFYDYRMTLGGRTLAAAPASRIADRPGSRMKRSLLGRSFLLVMQKP